MSNDFEGFPALAKYVGSIESKLADEGLLKVELEEAKKDLARMDPEQCKAVLSRLVHIPGLGPEAAGALEGKEAVQGGRVRRRSKSKGKKKKSKSPRRKH